MNRSLLPVAAASAVIGCGLSLALVEGLHLGGGRTTTVVEQAPLSNATDASSSSKGLTARDIYKRDAPGVVFIRADIVQKSQSTSPFDFGAPQEQRGQATGSGFVIDRKGTILTNAHVVNGAQKISVQFQNKQSTTAKVLGTDESTDLAVLKVDPAGQQLHPLALGSSKGVQVGDPAIAIGNPFGLERTLTTGVISAVQRTIQAPNNFQINDVLQTDAPINPGNSGGPLIDGAGRVIGINSQIETGGSGSSGGNLGIGFAVPIDTAKQIIPQLEKSGRVDRGFLGVSTLTIDKTLKGLNLPVGHGALVQSVTPGSPAQKAGIHAGNIAASLNGAPIQLGGDVITRIAGSDVRSDRDVVNAVAGRKAGDKVKVTLMRGAHRIEVTVTLGERPATSTP
jgi:S1-C subfamily serine protease